MTNLIRQHISSEVSQRQLQLLEAVVDRDLDGDESVWRKSVGVAVSRSSHVGRCWCGVANVGLVGDVGGGRLTALRYWTLQSSQ